MDSEIVASIILIIAAAVVVTMFLMFGVAAIANIAIWLR